MAYAIMMRNTPPWAAILANFKDRHHSQDSRIGVKIVKSHKRIRIVSVPVFMTQNKTLFLSFRVRNEESSFEKLVILYIHAFQLCIHEYNLLQYPLLTNQLSSL